MPFTAQAQASHNRPGKAEDLERQLQNHPQQDEERVDLLLRTPRRPGMGRDLVVLNERAKEALAISKKLNYKSGKARAYEAIAISFDPLNSADSLVYYYEKAYQAYTEIGDTSGAVETYFGMGQGLSWLGRYSEALEISLEVLDIYEREKNYFGIGRVYEFIGVLYMRQRQPQIAILNFEKSLEAFDMSGRDEGYIRLLNSLSRAYKSVGDAEKALSYINRSIEMGESRGAPVMPMYVTKGIIYSENGNYEAAEEAFTYALELANGVGWFQDQILAHYNLAEIDYKLGKFTEAAIHAREALRLTGYTKTRSDQRMINLMTLLALTEKELDNTDQAFDYLYRAKQLGDSLTREENLKTISDIQTKYETERKEAQIQLLEAENEAANLRFVIGLIIAIVVIISIVSGFVWYQKKKAAEKKWEVESIKSELEQYGTLLAEKNNFMSAVRENLASMNSSVRSMEARKELNVLIDSLHQNVSLSETEDELFKKIEHINSGFFRELREKSQEISTRDERLASLVRMDLSNKDIANILNVEPKSVKQAKYRLKKKLELSPETDLHVFLNSLAA